MIKPKMSGRLGLGDLLNENCSLLARWWRRFGQEKPLLRNTIATKYGEDKWGWLPKSIPRYRMSSLCNVIALAGDVSTVRREVFCKEVGFIVGDGRNVKFWLDN